MWTHHCTGEKSAHTPQKEEWRPQEGAVGYFVALLIYKSDDCHSFCSVNGLDKTTGPLILSPLICLLTSLKHDTTVSPGAFPVLVDLCPTVSCIRASRPVRDHISDARDISVIRICTNSWKIQQWFVKMLCFISHQQEVRQRIDGSCFLIYNDLLIPGPVLSRHSCTGGWLSFNIASWHKEAGM